MESQSDTEVIQLAQMPQLTEALADEDNWTGLTDAAARRKRQNRLNVRAYRRRRALEAQATQALSSSALVIASPQTQPQRLYWNEHRQTVTYDLPSSLVTHIRGSKSLLNYQESNSPCPRQEIVFPLSSDHLISLFQYNALRACLTNLAILDLLPIIPAECRSALDVVPAYITASVPHAIPPTFQPTTLQSTTPHSPWIDIIPSARWRDNLILAAGMYDEDELCCDTIGGLWEGFPDDEITHRGVIAWNSPWDVQGWEVSEGFWEKWGFLLRGCQEVLDSTNAWRRHRGDEPLAVEI